MSAETITQPAPNAARPFELGLYTFAERMADPVSGALMDPVERTRNLMETIEL